MKKTLITTLLSLFIVSTGVFVTKNTQVVSKNNQAIIISGEVLGVNTLKTGGLVSLPTTVLGPNLVSNGRFEDIDSSNKPVGWTFSNAFSMDLTNNRTGGSGTKSPKMKDADIVSLADKATQVIPVKKGYYTLRGWMKTELEVSTTKGAYIGIHTGSSYTYGGTRTKVIPGSTGWTYYELKNINITQDTDAKITLGSFGEPAGEAWFDDVELMEERPTNTIEVFMLYPNYRGILFSDQPQNIRFDVTVSSSVGNPSDYTIGGRLIDESTSALIESKTQTAASNQVIEFNGSVLNVGKTYLVDFELKRNSDQAVVGSYPSHRVVKESSEVRQQMTAWFDQNNRIILDNKPTFLIGAWDHGLGYYASEQTYEDNLQSARRLWELPINWYVNYGYGRAPNSSMTLFHNVLQRHNIYGVGIAHCHIGTEAKNNDGGNFWFFKATDQEIMSRASHPNFLGFYTVDECSNDMVPSTFENYQKIKRLDPDGITFAATDKPNGIDLWRDSVDLIGMDPYPLNTVAFADPVAPQGFKLNLVADWAKIAKNSVKNSRPFIMVLQYFQLYSNGRWPTQKDLRDMSYMAIVEGANGVAYWALGTNALAYSCNGSTPEKSPSGSANWCPFRVEQFNNLKSVVTELSSLQSVLASLDQPSLLNSNSNANIRTRVKYDNGVAYLIAYNYTNLPQTATFNWNGSPSGVIVYNENRNLNLNGNLFTDSFAPYEAHVYQIYTGSVPTPSPTTPTDTTAPNISAISVSKISTSTATITWSTSEPADTQLEYGLTTSYGSTSLLKDNINRLTNHVVNLVGLNPNTTYNYRVKSRDAAGNLAISGNLTLTTQSLSASSTQVNISNLRLSALTNSSVTISWNTNIGASSQVLYSLVDSVGFRTPEANVLNGVTSHSVNLLGLVPCSKYRFKVRSVVSGLESYSTVGNFLTSGCSGGLTPINEITKEVLKNSGDSVSLSNLQLTVPKDFINNNSAFFQIQSFSKDQFSSSVSPPDGKVYSNSPVFRATAYTSPTTTAPLFYKPINVTVSYTDSEIQNINESTLKLYRYHNGVWSELSNCSVNVSNNTITCTSVGFSEIVLVGDRSTTTAPVVSYGGGAGVSSSGGSQNTNSSQTLSSAPSSSSNAKYAGIKVLTVNTFFGSKHPEVLDLQKFLIAEGLLSSDSSTGFFGNLTESALKKFQAANNIVSLGSPQTTGFGFLGPKTRTKINQLLGFSGAQITVTQPVKPTSAQPKIIHAKLTKPISRGANGGDVVTLQNVLIKEGLLSADSATGFFGPLTEAALKAFQKKYNIVISGTPTTTGFGSTGPKTRAKVNELAGY